MDRFRGMTTFVAVAETGSFAAAARRLGVSAPTVTRLVAGLEAHLGARLLTRTTRSVTLTDAGARYLERARRILADIAEADAAASAERTVPTGRLVVAAPNLFGKLHVAPALSDYLFAHAAVVGELRLSNRLVNLVDEGIDVAVRIGALEDSGLIARAVGATRRVVVAAPSYLARHPAPRTPGDLAAHALIQLTSISAAPSWRFGEAGEIERVTFVPRFVTNSIDAGIGHAVRGGGLTMVLAYQVVDHLRAGRLRIVLADREPPPLPIQVVFPTARLLSAKVRTFVDFIADDRDWRFVDV